jgi:hypothetical protein
MGGKVRLVTTQNTYLSISGFEVWTGAAPVTKRVMRPFTPEPEREAEEPATEKMGGNKQGWTTSTYNVPANTKAVINQGSVK